MRIQNWKFVALPVPESDWSLGRGLQTYNLGVGGYGLWTTKSEGVGLIDRAISFQDF